MAEQVRMPRLSQTMTEGRLVEWLKSEGEPVRQGEPLVTIESDKANVELEAPISGILRRTLVDPGEDVPVDTPLGIIAGPDEDISTLASRHRPDVPVPTAAPTAAARTPVTPSQAPGGRRRVSPLARRVAKELDVDLGQVSGTGDGGLVTEKDVRAFAAVRPAPTVPGEEIAEAIPLAGIRKRIAERMALSRRTAADVTTVVDVDMTEVGRLRKAAGLSYVAYVAWAAARALREFPILNSSLIDDRILVKKSIHLGVAVALDGGLVVPVVRDADTKSLTEIGQEIDATAARARKEQLTPDSLTGSTFTITNSGVFGSLMFTPIINYPEMAILGMGKVADTPVVREGEIVARKIMYLCLSYDHRVVDGAVAVTFLQAVKRRLEHPAEG